MDIHEIARSRCVLLMMGAAGVGKSTAAAELARQLKAHIVSYDAHQRRQPGDDGSQAVSAAALVSAHADWQRCVRRECLG